MADNHLPEINPPPFTPSPSIPLHLSGFLTGDTIQVQGDTDDLQFSVQFNIHHKQPSDIHSPFTPPVTPDNRFPFPGKITRKNQNISSSSSYRTPPNHEEEVDQKVNAIEWVPKMEESDAESSSMVMTTRLRSGVLTPVSYYPTPRVGSSCRSRRKKKKKKGDEEDVLERVLRRHSFPIRPCSSYSFFVMSKWDFIDSCSFGEKSKRLAEMWSNLPPDQKQIFEEMALKDNARYKRQCKLLADEI